MWFPNIINSVDCQVEECPTREKTLGRLWENFMVWHWKSKLAILQEVQEPLPWYDKCGMHMQSVRLFKHRQSDKCHKSTERGLQRRYVEMEVRCG